MEGQYTSPTTADEHIADQRGKSRQKLTLLQSILISCGLIPLIWMMQGTYWNAVKLELVKSIGLHKRYDKKQKILSQLNQLKPSQRMTILISSSKALAFIMVLRYPQAILHLIYTVPSNSKTGLKDLKEKIPKHDSLLITLVDWTGIHDGQGEGLLLLRSLSMIAVCDTKDELRKVLLRIYNLITRAYTKEVSTCSIKTSEPNPNESTSTVQYNPTSESEAELNSFAGTPIQDPIIVQDKPIFPLENPYSDVEDKGSLDSGCSRSMDRLTWKDLMDYQEFQGVKIIVTRTPQQNGVAERKNRTLINAAKTMLADSKLPTMFWTEAVRTLVSLEQSVGN
ncbi:ribonuclease H-like domain-containing protein [Tanacetum coccineum]